jgi:hypothetical protein
MPSVQVQATHYNQDPVEAPDRPRPSGASSFWAAGKPIGGRITGKTCKLPVSGKCNLVPMLEIAIAVVIGFALGYGVREWISRRRQQAARARRDLGLD